MKKNNTPVIILLIVAIVATFIYIAWNYLGFRPFIDESDQISEKSIEEQDLSESLPGDPPEITSLELRKLLETQDNVTIINPESRENFYKKHIPGSIAFPHEEVAVNISALPRDHIIVVTSSGSELGCNLSKRISRILAEEGFPDVRDHHEGWAEWEKKGFPTATNDLVNIPRISSHDLEKDILSGEDMIVLDVRTADAFEQGHLKNAAHIPFDDLVERIDEIPHNKKIAFYDDSGEKIQIVGEALVDNRYYQVQALVGGFNEWILRDKSVE